MKLARFVGIAMLAIIVTIGLLSTVFLPRIQAALLTSGRQPNSLSVGVMGKSMPTAVRAIPTKAQPMSMVLAQDNIFYSLRFRVVGSQLMARAWPTGQAEPQNWLVMATDNTFTNGFGGLRPVVVKGINVTITSFTETSVANP